jgi:hypothetical protein
MRGLLWVGAFVLLSACGNDSSAVVTEPEVYDFRGAGLTYWDDVQPIYEQYCGACHGGCIIDVCAAGSCFANFYEATLFSAGDHGFNFAEWGLFRVEWTMARAGPPESWLTDVNKDALDVSVKHMAIIRDWIYDGMEEGTPGADHWVPPSSEGCVPDCTDKACGCDGCGGLCQDLCEDKKCNYWAGKCLQLMD